MNLEKEMAITPIWRQAFRPFFLGGTCFSIFALILWSLQLNGGLNFSPYGNTYFWHIHEMIFGFVGAIIVGFLLTAVQNWTGLRATHGIELKLLFFTWLTARILMLTNIALLSIPLIIIDTGFYLAAAGFMAQLVWRSKNSRNYFFVPVLVGLASLNLIAHLSIMESNPAWLTWATRSTIFLIMFIITVITGRVLPMFTANGTQTKKAENKLWLEHLVLGASLGILLTQLANLQLEKFGTAIGVLFSFAAFLNAYRSLRWRPWVTVKVPIVWSLHLAYWFIPLAYVLFALHFFGFDVTYSTALHALTVGVIGSLILAMIARIALGHSGRPIQPPAFMSLSFIAIALAGLVRIIAGLAPQWLPVNGYVLATALWAFAFGAYVFFYTRILITPRSDGRPG